MLRVWIGGWRHVEHLDPSKAHTVYQVEVTTETGSYHRVERRYSAFHNLNKATPLNSELTCCDLS